MERAGLLVDARRYDEALELLAPVLATNPESTEARRVLCDALLAADRAREALEIVEAGLARTPDDLGLVQQRVRVLIVLRRTVTATTDAQRLVSEAPGVPYHWYLLAIAASLSPHDDERARIATHAAERVEALQPASDLALRAFGIVALETGRGVDAETHFATLVTRNPADHHALHGLGQALGMQGRNAEAATLFARATALEPRSFASATAAIAAAGRHVDRIAPDQLHSLFLFGGLGIGVIALGVLRGPVGAPMWLSIVVIAAAIAIVATWQIRGVRRRFGDLTPEVRAAYEHERRRITRRSASFSTGMLVVVAGLVTWGLVDPPEPEPARVPPPIVIPTFPTSTTRFAVDCAPITFPTPTGVGTIPRTLCPPSTTLGR